ncbi:MAG: 2-succinyl-5-enolpyruvyl-6-hydroxy-3-cyclohexene-1-carboxylate synthase, partial [Candidatus Heimdallarchaeota archaeon LC_2]
MLILNDQGSFNFIRSLIFIDELARAGITDVCISPGSRSTPLALAFYHHGEFNIHIIVDERSAAFFAMGIAKGSKLPVVLLCTSGTATANYFPAIIESDKTNIPLIIITADRPLKLRNTGVNQIIDQIELYGNKVRCFEDILEPNISEYNKSKIREYTDYLRNTACKIISSSTKKYQNGPVHINFSFSKPLEPKNQNLIDGLKKLLTEDDLFKGKKGNLPFVSKILQKSEYNISNLENLMGLISDARRIIVLGGPQEDEKELPNKITEL